MNTNPFVNPPHLATYEQAERWHRFVDRWAAIWVELFPEDAPPF